MKRLKANEIENAEPSNGNDRRQKGRRLTDEEWRYVQHHLSMQWRLAVGGGAFFLALASGFGFIAWLMGGIALYFMIGLGAVAFVGAVAMLGIGFTRLRRYSPDRKQPIMKRRIRIFALPLIWFQANKGCEVRSEPALIPPHWSRFFNHLRPIDGDGCFDIEAEMYETSEVNYVLSLSNGISVGREVPMGLLDTLAMGHARYLLWGLFVLYGSTFTLFMLGAALGIVPVAESFSTFLVEAKWLIVGAAAFLAALGVPAIYFWRQHKQALARIEAMYEAEGLPERGHAKNVGSAIDNASSDKSNHESSNVPPNEKHTS